MKRFFLTIGLILLIFLQTLAQKDFKPGYIILNNNRIENGLIKYGDKKDNYSKCVFKPDPESEESVFLPGEIMGYRFIDGKYYISQNPDSINTKKIFLEYLFDGIVDLYYYFDNSGDHYYIQKNNNRLKELKNDIRKITSTVPTSAGISQTYAESSPVAYEKESKEYIGILKVNFQDSPETMKKTDYVSFNVNSLIDISEAYHKAVCPGIECINYVKNKTKIIFGFGPIMGLSYSNLSFSKNTPTYKFDDKYPESMGVAFGVFLNISDPHISEKVSIQLEPSIHIVNYSADNSTINLSTLNVPVFLRYSIPYKKIQPFFDFGLVYNRFIKFESNSVNYENIELISGNDQIGFAAGIGTKINIKNHAVLFLARYEYLVGQHMEVLWDDIPGNVNLYSKSINFLIAYKF